MLWHQALECPIFDIDPVRMNSPSLSQLPNANGKFLVSEGETQCGKSSWPDRGKGKGKVVFKLCPLWFNEVTWQAQPHDITLFPIKNNAGAPAAVSGKHLWREEVLQHLTFTCLSPGVSTSLYKTLRKRRMCHCICSLQTESTISPVRCGWGVPRRHLVP